MRKKIIIENKIRTINEDQSKWVKEKLKEQKKKESGKALYDTSSGSEPGDIVDLGAETLEIVEDQELAREGNRIIRGTGSRFRIRSREREISSTKLDILMNRF